ncbi:sulfurtransferase TusA family protein [Myxococcota bacterium]|nr:sulfurtransferase TusA family protein [Myxococcota bacterium]
MAAILIDAKGMRCPEPILTLASRYSTFNPGDLITISGDCSTFEDDIRKWCDRMKVTLLAVQIDGTAKIMQIKI